MAGSSEIGWTDATWPIVAGCEYVSPGCSNCWAVRDTWRLMHNPHAGIRRLYAATVRKTAEGKLVWTGLVRPLPERLIWPLHWRKGRRVFVCSQADLFHKAVPFEFIAAAFGVMAMAKQHTFQVLTKHPARAREFFDWIANDDDGPTLGCVLHAREKCGVEAWAHEPQDDGPAWPLPNVWIGVTVEDQRRADERIPELHRTPAAVRWLSVEPMLEQIDLTITVPSEHLARGEKLELADLDWVVCGGESAQTRSATRPFDIEWARDLLQQCRAAKVAFHMKQLGTKPVCHVKEGSDGRVELPILVGKSSRYKWHEPEHWPADLRVQEFPA